jgi:septum formation protein
MTMRTAIPLILASASPRRKALLTDLGVPFEVMVRPVDEAVPPGLPPGDVAEDLAVKKADAFKDLYPTHLILSADTIVVVDHRILGKPGHREEALDMLRSLSGRTHQVITGVAISHGPLTLSAHEVTTVQFADLSAQECEHYVDTFRPFDKAGAYGIQEWIGMVGISAISGDYYNVMGLPTRRVWQMLQPHLVW